MRQEKHTHYLIAIDPGMTGAAARLRVNTKVWKIDLLDVFNFKKNAQKQIDIVHMAEQIKTWHDEAPFTMLFIEEVWAISGQNIQSMFKFGVAYGAACGILNALGVPIMRLKPMTWKSCLGLSADKKQSMEKAKQLFPSRNNLWSAAKNHDMAEAALIAYVAAYKYQKFWDVQYASM